MRHLAVLATMLAAACTPLRSNAPAVTPPPGAAEPAVAPAPAPPVRSQPRVAERLPTGDLAELSATAQRGWQRAAAVRLPPLGRVRSYADLKGYLQGAAKGWHDDRFALALRADRHYRTVIAQLRTSDKALKAALANARRWRAFMQDYRAVVYPAAWDRAGLSPMGDGGDGPPLMWSEVRATFLTSFDAMAEPAEARARRANDVCLSLALEHHHLDDATLACIEWLSKHYPVEYGLIDEFHHRPHYQSDGLSERYAPMPDPR